MIEVYTMLGTYPGYSYINTEHTEIYRTAPIFILRDYILELLFLRNLLWI